VLLNNYAAWLIGLDIWHVCVLLCGMFVREKPIGPYRYVYLVESVREGGRTKQRIIKNLGRKEQVDAKGDLDRLARSAARLAQRSMILSLVDQEGAPTLATRRIGPSLAFERLWRETGCRAVIEDLAAERSFGFSLERACFLTVLHRLMVSGSDRSADAWREDYRIEGTEELALHHLYRAMGWLGEELPGSEQADRAVRSALSEGPDRRTALRDPPRPVQRAVGRLHGHHQPLFRRRGRRDPRAAGPL
jgi:hypothetical protein